MRKLVVIVLAFLIYEMSLAQIIDENNKNIIGFNRIQTGNSSWLDIQLIGSNSKFQLFDQPNGKYFIKAQSGNNYIEFPQNAFVKGSLGLGTTTPRTKLDIRGDLLTGLGSYNSIQLATHYWSGSHGILFNAYKEIYQNGGLSRNTKFTNDPGAYSGGAGAVFFYGNGGTMDFCISPNSTGKGNAIDWGDPKLRIYRNGNVAIGKSSADAKLDVAGTIKAQEIEVTLASMQDMQLNGTLAANNITYTTNGQTADHVFEEDYDLRELSEVEAFITEHKHLPEIPSAVVMEEEGVNLAEMNKLLLQKVEELTLYAIEQKAEVERQKAEAEKVRREESEARKSLEDRLTKIEALLLLKNQ